MVGSTEGLFLSVTEEVLGLLEGQIDQLVIGGVATAAYVDGGWSGEGADLDLLLSREDAKTALTILGDAGFATEEKDPVWLFKAARPGRHCRPHLPSGWGFHPRRRDVEAVAPLGGEGDLHNGSRT